MGRTLDPEKRGMQSISNRVNKVCCSVNMLGQVLHIIKACDPSHRPYIRQAKIR